MAIVDVGSGYKYAATENGINSAINAASPGDTVFVHSPSVYIEGYININKSIIFRGESWDSTAFLLGVHAGGEPTIYDSSADGTSDGAIKITANNVECCHFKVYAPQAIKSDDAVYGGGHGDQRNAFFVNQVSGIKIHNIKIPKYVYNDGIRFRYSHDCQVYDCEFPGGNHDTISFLHSYNISVKNVLGAFATNTFMRWYYAHGITVSNVTIDGNLGGQSCFEMQNQDGGGSSIDKVLVKNVNKPFFTYGQGICSVSNTVICSGCNANCTGTNITSNASASTNWQNQGYGYNASSISIPTPTPTPEPQPTPTIQITAKLPTTSSITATEDQIVKFSISANVDCTATITIQGINYQMTKISNYTYVKEFTFAEAGTYPVSLKLNKSGYNSASASWNCTINAAPIPTPTPTITFVSKQPNFSTLTVNKNEPIKFSLTTNLDCNGTINIEGIIYSLTKSGYTYYKDFAFANIGSFTIVAKLEKAGYNSLNNIWLVSVVEPTPTPIPTIKLLSKSPNNSSITVDKNKNTTFIVASDVECTVNVTIQGVSYPMTKISNYSYSKDFAFANTGTYVVAVKMEKSGYNSVNTTWTVNVKESVPTGLLIVAKEPSTVTPSVVTGSTVTFSLAANMNCTGIISINGIMYQLENISTANYSYGKNFTFGKAGTYQIIATITKEGYNPVSQNWSLTVTENPVPPLPSVVQTEIVSVIPTGDKTVQTNMPINFSVQMNQVDDISWYVNGELIKTVQAQNATNAITFADESNYTVEVICGGDKHTWTIAAVNSNSEIPINNEDTNNLPTNDQSSAGISSFITTTVMASILIKAISGI